MNSLFIVIVLVVAMEGVRRKPKRVAVYERKTMVPIEKCATPNLILIFSQPIKVGSQNLSFSTLPQEQSNVEMF